MKYLTRIKYKWPRLYRLISRVRFSLARESLVELPLGFKVFLNPYSYVETEIRNGNFEIRRASFLKSALAEPCTFVDIGANIGYYSLLAASLGPQVHCFEPDIRNVQRLRRNIAVNGFDDRIAVNNIALGESQGTLPIYSRLSDNYGRVSLVKDESSVESDHIAVETLDSSLLLPDQRVVVKIDVEGFEEQVLLGASQWLLNVKKGSLWIVEVHLGQGVELSRILSFFPDYNLTFFDDSEGCERSLNDPPVGDPVLLARK